MKGEASALHVPLAMLKIMNRDTPDTADFYSRHWQMNISGLLILVMGAQGLHLLLALMLSICRKWCARAAGTVRKKCCAGGVLVEGEAASTATQDAPTPWLKDFVAATSDADDTSAAALFASKSSQPPTHSRGEPSIALSSSPVLKKSSPWAEVEMSSDLSPRSPVNNDVSHEESLQVHVQP